MLKSTNRQIQIKDLDLLVILNLEILVFVTDFQVQFSSSKLDFWYRYRYRYRYLRVFPYVSGRKILTTDNSFLSKQHDNSRSTDNTTTDPKHVYRQSNSFCLFRREQHNNTTNNKQQITTTKRLESAHFGRPAASPVLAHLQGPFGDHFGTIWGPFGDVF